MGSPMMFSSLQSRSELIIIGSQTSKGISAVKIDTHMYQDVLLCHQHDEDRLKAYDRALEGKVDADVTNEDQVLCYKASLWIPISVDLRKVILQGERGSKVAGRMGQAKTIELVGRHFFCLEMDQWIEDYVRSCPDCQRNKAAVVKRRS